jgi:GrpB-like predicted nucleotidyltransferase (UPF0157 family)
MLIQEYQSSWKIDFNHIKKTIHETLGDIGIGIEHVGSTSINNMAAKPIIDIDIIYKKSFSFENVKGGLEKLGYYHNGDQGIKGREAFKRINTRNKHLVLDVIAHHLYVCDTDSEELQRHLLFRDYLKNNEKEKREYEKIKYEIAERANQDRNEYASLKEIMATDFVESIIKKAKQERNNR